MAKLAPSGPASYFWVSLFVLSTHLQLALFILNMLPAKPLDGYGVLKGFLLFLRVLDERRTRKLCALCGVVVSVIVACAGLFVAFFSGLMFNGGLIVLLGGYLFSLNYEDAQR